MRGLLLAARAVLFLHNTVGEKPTVSRLVEDYFAAISEAITCSIECGAFVASVEQVRNALPDCRLAHGRWK